MSEFFKGWRRKAGCVTLLMALALAGGWVKSFDDSSDPLIADLIDFCELLGIPKKERAIAGLGTFNHSLSLMSYEEMKFEFSSTSNGSTNISPGTSQLNDQTKADLDECPSANEIEELPSSNRLQVNDLVLRQSRSSQSTTSTMTLLVPVAFLAVPFWSIVIPMVLLSAYLLLSRPRKSAATKRIGPTPEKVA